MKKLLQFLRDNADKAPRPANLVKNDAGTEARLYIYDVIDAYWGVSAEAVAKAIAQLDSGTTLHLHINSPGGDVFEGRAIRTAIAQHSGKTIAHIDGLAASAATTIADGADEVLIAEGAFFMIHNGWTYAMGDKTELGKTIELLNKVDAAIAADYARRTGKSAEEVTAWMDAETWFTAEEAVAAGFATALQAPPSKTSNQARSWNLTAYDKTPKALLEPQQPPTEPDYAALRAHNERRLRVLQIA